MVDPVVHRPWVMPEVIHHGDIIQCENGHYFATIDDPGAIGGDWPTLMNDKGESLDLSGNELPLRCLKVECGAVAVKWGDL